MNPIAHPASPRSRRTARTCLIAALSALGLLVAGALAASPARAFEPVKEYGHVGIVSDGLREVSRPSSDGATTYRFSPSATDDLRHHTAEVDDLVDGEPLTSAAHCDSEELPACTQRMIDLKADAIRALASPLPDWQEARRQTGRALHTVQDFYSHTNWIELGNIGIEPALGRDTLAAAGPDEETCEYLDAGHLAESGLTHLTSGYSVGPVPLRPNELPFGPKSHKCVHGWPDGEGLHKDNPDRPGHRDARNAAVGATIDFVDQILDAPASRATTVRSRRSWESDA